MIRAVSPPSEAALLNEPQRRHLGITLVQLQRFLNEARLLAATPALREGLVTETDDLPPAFAHAAPAAIAALTARIGRMAERFHLPAREQSRFRWVRAALSVSIDNLQDTRARALKAYGEVHPELPEALDPALADLQTGLRELLRLLEHGPESAGP
jgi:hypothetical protein